MKKPALSILLPFRNAVDTLGDCLESIRRQTLSDFEFLAVDDYSTDASATLVAAHALTDPRKIGNTLEGVPVVAPQWLQREPKPLVLCYVARHGARELIEQALSGYGYRKGRDFLQVG